MTHFIKSDFFSFTGLLKFSCRQLDSLSSCYSLLNSIYEKPIPGSRRFLSNVIFQFHFFLIPARITGWNKALLCFLDIKRVMLWEIEKYILLTFIHIGKAEYQNPLRAKYSVIWEQETICLSPFCRENFFICFLEEKNARRDQNEYSIQLNLNKWSNNYLIKTIIPSNNSWALT